jgi:phosphoribosylamine--glycine ligase
MRLAKEAKIMKITEPRAVSDYAVRSRAEIAIVGPEAPLVSGVVDALEELEIGSVGPTKQLAALEGDKAFCRDLLSRHSIEGNPKYRIFTDLDSVESYLMSVGPVAIKPAGLTAGKGVKVTGEDLPNKEAEADYAKQVLQRKIGGIQAVVIEEKLEGEEYSMQAFVDGKSVYVMPLVQDHKRAYEGDMGPNTGGMGSYSDRDHLLPFVSSSDLERSSRTMNRVVQALREDTGVEYKGVLYGQFMLARGQEEEKPTPKLIEFNCRFGDPEAMNALTILSEDTDFAEMCQGIAAGDLKPGHVSFDSKATVCKYLVPKDYPERATADQVISVDEDAIARLNARVFYASVDVKNGDVVTTASRTVGVVGISDTITEAEQVAENATAFVKGPLRHRRDIGTSALIQKRIEHVRSIGKPRVTLQAETS